MYILTENVGKQYFIDKLISQLLKVNKDKFKAGIKSKCISNFMIVNSITFIRNIFSFKIS